ncbi:hypothetical protein V3851_11010 [Paenibacillus sp. M1]|uniref:Prepilin-type N-terminal cleavage/methylation domain-containing protein n=1 Tax=Paenibacillus haidiansis TaxID=1574488 RepID=A0ABU7VTW3_9BACL
MQKLVKHLRNEEGLTLVELLAVISLSALLLILVSTILTTSLLASGRIDDETRLRNEAITLSAALQSKLRNTTGVTVLPDNNATGPVYEFNASVIEDVSSGATRTVSVKLSNDHLYINGVRLDSEGVTLDGTYFIRGNQDLEIHLQAGLEHKEEVEPLYLFVSIKMVQ